MNPQQQEQTPPFDMVPPAQGVASEQLPAAPVGEAAGSKAIEQGISTPPVIPPIVGAPPRQTPFAPLAGVPTVTSPSAPSSSSQLGTMPQIADDTDLIEREWVEKAKEIVEQTAHDPHAQNQAINRVKVDYLKKRYNKDIKLTDG